MSDTQFGADTAITAGSTARYTCSFAEPSGNTINSAAVTAITATLRDHLGTVVNERDEQDVLNVNGGSMSNTTFTLLLGPDDTQSIGAKELQSRSMVLNVEYDSGVLVHEVGFFVRKP